MTERFEPYEIQPEFKVKEARDPKLSNAYNYTIYKEDHTLGNLIRMQLLKDKSVTYAGYKLPHPLDNFIVISVQTDGTVDPKTAFNKALSLIKADLDTLETSFSKSLGN